MEGSCNQELLLQLARTETEEFGPLYRRWLRCIYDQMIEGIQQNLVSGYEFPTVTGSLAENTVLCRLFRGSVELEVDLMVNLRSITAEQISDNLERPGFARGSLDPQKVKDCYCEQMESFKKKFGEVPFLMSDRLEINGPAVTSKKVHETTSFKYPVDSVPSLKCNFWPNCATQWKTRQEEKKTWLSPIVNDIIKAGCHLVPKSPQDMESRLDWRYSMSMAEIIIHDQYSEKMRQIFYCFKCLFYCHIGSLPYIEEKHLFSYIAKTIMLWETEDRGKEGWDKMSIEEAVKILFMRLRNVLRKKTLQNYFIPECNILAELPPKLLEDGRKKVKDILDFNSSPLLQSIPIEIIQDVEKISIHFLVIAKQASDLDLKSSSMWSTVESFDYEQFMRQICHDLFDLESIRQYFIRYGSAGLEEILRIPLHDYFVNRPQENMLQNSAQYSSVYSSALEKLTDELNALFF